MITGLYQIIPTIMMLVAIGVVISRLAAYPIFQIFLLIVTAYTAAFPLLDHSLSSENFKYPFVYNQVILSALFLAPLAFFLSIEAKRLSLEKMSEPASSQLHFSPILPWLLVAHAVLFLFTAIIFGLFFVRLGYADFLQTYDNTPAILLFHHRLAVEGAFFVILCLIAFLRIMPKSAIRRAYVIALAANLLVFGAFFLINSRMQFLLLLILVLSSNYVSGRINFWRLTKLGFGLLVVIVSLTLLREFVIEQNNRLYGATSFELLRQTLWLISARLDSVIMVNMAAETSYNIFAPNPGGIWFFWKFNSAPIFDPEFYALMKSAEMTSPSVWMMNGILLRNDVDFPKSMMVEILLMFGAGVLPLFALLLSRVVSLIQYRLRFFNISDKGFIFALYILPLIFQFEKEFTGFVLSVFKWLPLLFLMIWFRPKVRESQSSVRMAHA